MVVNLQLTFCPNFHLVLTCTSENFFLSLQVTSSKGLKSTDAVTHTHARARRHTLALQMYSHYYCVRNSIKEVLCLHLCVSACIALSESSIPATFSTPLADAKEHAAPLNSILTASCWQGLKFNTTHCPFLPSSSAFDTDFFSSWESVRVYMYASCTDQAWEKNNGTSEILPTWRTGIELKLQLQL